MRTKLLVLILALAVLGWGLWSGYVWYLSKTQSLANSGIANYAAYASYRDRSRLLVDISRNEFKRSAAWAIIELYSITPGEQASPILIDGVKLSSVQRAWLPHLFGVNKPAFSVRIQGALTGSSDPTVKVLGHKMALTHKYSGSLGEKWVNDRSVELERRSDEHGSKIRVKNETPFGVHCQRMWLPSGQVRADWISLDPAPVFQEDVFSEGRWKGTFAVWSSEASMKSSVVTIWEGGRILKQVSETNK